MAESFENLDNILRDWVKNKVQKCIVEALNRWGTRSRGKKDKAISFSEIDSWNILEQSQSAVKQDY